MTQAPTPGPLSGDTALVATINYLRADEGDTVSLLCDNPDFNGQPSNAVECNGGWTDWTDKRFAGDSLFAALNNAALAKAVATKTLDPTAPVENHESDLIPMPWKQGVSGKLDVSTAPVEASGSERFQDRCGAWVDVCFGPESRLNVEHRNARFLEEAVELVQASGMTETAATDVVRYAFGRPQGEINQEVGGVMMTLAAHCLATGVDMTAEGERELARVWTKVDQIRAKEAAKPSFDPRPQPSGETREVPTKAEILGVVRQYCAPAWCSVDRLTDALHALSARPAPVASGGQHSSATDFPPDDVLACVGDRK